jgi:hypothetical protein
MQDISMLALRIPLLFGNLEFLQVAGAFNEIKFAVLCLESEKSSAMKAALQLSALIITVYTPQWKHGIISRRTHYTQWRMKSS